MTIFKYNEIDFKNIEYTAPEKKGLVYYSGISYLNEPLYIQTPKLKCMVDGNDCIKRKSPSLDVENIDNDFKFYDFLLSLDEANVKNTYKNSFEWFSKEIPEETIDEMYKRLLKPVKKGNRPTYSFKIPTSKGKPQCPIFDQNKICHMIDKCLVETDVELIIHIRGLKILKQNFYCDAYISQIKVYLSNEEKYSIIKDYSFKDSEKSQHDKEDNIVEKETEREPELKKVESKPELKKVESKPELKSELKSEPEAETNIYTEENESKLDNEEDKNSETINDDKKSEDESKDIKIKEYEEKLEFLQEQINLMKKDFN